MWDFPLFPEQASTVAGRVDALYFFMVGLTAFFSILIGLTIAIFAIKYRRGNKVDRTNPIKETKTLEAIWMIVPFIIVMVIFVWGADIYFVISRPPRHAQDIYVMGKQWMWKFQHVNGNREINELHIPVGQPVKLTMTSQDVIHDVFIPAFRVKQDVIPGRYTQLWFEATKPGIYHLFCAEYCGTQHSGMIGRVVAMEPEAYEQWLSGGRSNEPMSVAGERVFQQQGCVSCHEAENGGRGPTLVGLFGKEEQLRDGATAVADEQYIRESILNPAAKLVAGYDPVMPTYQGRINEEDLLQLLAYIKSLAKPTPGEGEGGRSSGADQSAGGPPREQARGTTNRPDVKK